LEKLNIVTVALMYVGREKEKEKEKEKNFGFKSSFISSGNGPRQKLLTSFPKLAVLCKTWPLTELSIIKMNLTDFQGEFRGNSHLVNMTKLYEQSRTCAGFHYWLNHIIGLSGVRALPLAAGINEGGHYFRYFSFFSSSCSYHRYSKPQKGLAKGFKLLHGLLKKNNKNSGEKIKFGPPPPGPLGGDF
jgi:hypothetical protein